MDKEYTSWTEADIRHGGEVPTVHGCGVALRQCVTAIRHRQIHASICHGQMK